MEDAVAKQIIQMFERTHAWINSVVDDLPGSPTVEQRNALAHAAGAITDFKVLLNMPGGPFPDRRPIHERPNY